MELKKKSTDIIAGVVEGKALTGMNSHDIDKGIPCYFLLNEIMQYVEQNDINIERELAIEYKNPTRVQRVGKFVEKLSFISGKCGHPLSILNGVPAYYNGKYWQKIKDEYLGNFFKESATLMGVDKYEAMYCDFLKKTRSTFDLYRILSPEVPENECIMNCANSTLHITTDGVRPENHRPEDGLLYQLPYNYDPKAKAPKFLSWLTQMVPYENDRLNLQEFMGSCFTSTKLEKVLYLHGSRGNNGKSTFMLLMKSALGVDNVSFSTLEKLTESGSDGMVARSQLAGKLLNACPDVAGEIDCAGEFKRLASGEDIEVRLPYRDNSIHLHAGTYARLMFCCNYLPTFSKSVGDAEKRRFLFIEFDQHIDEEKVNRLLPEEIASEELPGILNWIIDGLLRLSKANWRFTKNPRSEIMAERFLEANNNVRSWMVDTGIKPPTDEIKKAFPSPMGKEISIQARELFKGTAALYYSPEQSDNIESYERYCLNNGLKSRGRNKFYESLKQQGFKIYHTNKGDFIKVWKISAQARADELEARENFMERTQKLFY